MFAHGAIGDIFFQSSKNYLIMMKKIPHVLVLLLLGSATVLQCTDHGEGLGPEKVQFTFSLAEADEENGRALTGDVPDALLLSLETGSGESVFIDKKVTLLRMGDSFVTEPLELAPGRYNITDFRLAVDETTVLYATPLKGSPLSKAVNHPLPYPFTVSKNKSTAIAMEVIKVATHTPEEFGYASFGIHPVNPLRVAAFIATGSGNTLTTAEAWIVEDRDTIKQLTLGATVNFFPFRGDPDLLRTLIVVKPGYNTFVKEFVYADLVASLNGSPWNIILTESIFTTTLYFNDDIFRPKHFGIQMSGQSGSVTIDWGDGTSEPYELSGNTTPYVNHDYGFPARGMYKINITGDLDKIETLLYDRDVIKYINVQGLIALREMSTGNFIEALEEIDLTHNTRLEKLSMISVRGLRKIILPERSIIRYIDVSGSAGLTQAGLDDLVDQVYTSVYARNTMYGHFKLLNMHPPSPASAAKLDELRNYFGWTVEQQF